MHGMWQGIEGHDAVVEYFRETLRANRLATTYLFVGPEGIGKLTFARKLAQTLLCTEHDPSEMNPCGQCESCRLALAGTHPDLEIVSLQPGKSELSIEQFVGDQKHRNQEGMCHNIALRPMLARRRVAIIDDADWMNIHAANFLLKTLEEPPPNAVIILVGASRSRQLPTILSRAQIIRFRPLPEELVSQLALEIGIVSDAAAASKIAERAGGSLTQARELANAALWEMHDRLLAQWFRGEFDGVRLARDVEEFVNDAGKEAEARRQRLRELLAIFSRSLSSRLQDATGLQETEAALAAIDRCLEAAEQIDRNANQSTLIATWIDDLRGILQGRGRPAA
jgi:DNA polymerase-3 subunit delta'